MGFSMMVPIKIRFGGYRDRRQTNFVGIPHTEVVRGVANKNTATKGLAYWADKYIGKALVASRYLLAHGTNGYLVRSVKHVVGIP